MGKFLIAFNAVFPNTALIVIGYLSRRFKLTDRDGAEKMNRFCFYLLVPALVFKNIYEAESDISDCVPLLIFCITGIMLEFSMGWLIVGKITSDRPTQATLIQTIFRTNVLIMGIPIAQSIYHDAGLMVVIAAIVVPVFNILASVLFETYRNGKIGVLPMCLKVMKNPLIVATICALFCKLLRIEFPAVVNKVVHNLAATGGCLMLVVLGASLELAQIRDDRSNLIFSLLMRLIVLPGIALSAAVPLGFRSLPLLTILIIFGCPTASTGHVMAQQMGANGNLAAETLAGSTVLSCITLFLWLCVLNAAVLL